MYLTNDIRRDRGPLDCIDVYLHSDRRRYCKKQSARVSRSAAVFILIFLCTMTMIRAGEPHNNKTAEDELLKLEATWNQAHLGGDAAALDRLWSDDFEVVVPKMPVMKKSDVLAFVRSGRMKFAIYSTSNLQVRLYGDTAVVTGRMKRSRTLNGQSIEDNWQFTKIYRFTEGQWRVLHFQASDAPTA